MVLHLSCDEKLRSRKRSVKCCGSSGVSVGAKERGKAGRGKEQRKSSDNGFP